MSITVKPVTPDFVAEISGRDLRRVTTRDVASTVEQAA